ncbi:hypothetical protein Tco_0671857 [Tanacetum coccineum]
MLRRSQPSGAQNRKRNKKEQEYNKAQFGSLEPFVVRHKKNSNNVEENIENPINNENSKNDDVNVNEINDVYVNEIDDVDANKIDDVDVNWIGNIEY